MRRRTQTAGFSLIELLVVVAIITVLVGLILPALAASRVGAGLARCGANVRSIGQGLNLYANDDHEVLPYWSGWQVKGGDGSAPDSPGPGWTEQMADDLPTAETYQCPARDRGAAPYCYFLSARYTFERLGKQYTSLRQADVQFPAQFVLSDDCNQPELFARPYGAFDGPPDCDQDDATFPPLFFEGELVPHRGKSNILFFDGHSAGFNAFQKDAMTWHGTKMTDWSMQ
jgi:prepilin-type processing-associated H-X9-DG protein/prepilin-type N-terminal cleavage/methylation domain-containing protein